MGVVRVWFISWDVALGHGSMVPEDILKNLRPMQICVSESLC